MNSPVVRVDPEDREGEPRWRLVDGLDHLAGGLVLHRAVHRPARRDIGHGQGEAELAARVPDLVAHEVDLDEARLVLGPLGPGANGDLIL